MDQIQSNSGNQHCLYYIFMRDRTELYAKPFFQIPHQPYAANSLMQIISNVSIYRDLELQNYFWATLSASVPAVN